MQFRKGKFSSLAPGLNSTLNLRCPKEAGALGSFGSLFILGWDVHIIASTAMLCAVATGIHRQFRYLGPGPLCRDDMSSPERGRLTTGGSSHRSECAVFCTFCSLFYFLYGFGEGGLLLDLPSIKKGKTIKIETSPAWCLWATASSQAENRDQSGNADGR
jgi:hypothetical protein